MANLQESEAWVDGIYQLETTDPVMGGPDGVDNIQAKQLGSRTKFLKKNQDSLVKRVDDLEKTTDQELMAAIGQEIVSSMEKSALAFSEIEKTKRFRNQTGQVRFVNRGTRRGCTVTKSTTATRNLTFEEGELFANGRVYFLPQRINSAAVPSNNTAAPATCVAFARVTATGIELDVSNLGSDAPADAIPLYRISVPAGNNSGSDPYLTNVTITDVRRIEPDYPLMLASPPAALVLWPFPFPVGDLGWQLAIDIVSSSGDAATHHVLVSERASNGARLALAHYADDVIVKYSLTNNGV
ncbi:hypothetical protein [Aeromonas hydrophila]|uniref:hypothetical protein n=1 Tax=Aeromonas hydrophila TaxID=644 RepID=UPI000447EC86|nr:hypothetical protein [Aeromonas hydrophila]EZH78022.1 hypothetical protein AT59_23015 [Aeromonas hydrophila AD9]